MPGRAADPADRVERIARSGNRWFYDQCCGTARRPPPQKARATIAVLEGRAGLFHFRQGRQPMAAAQRADSEADAPLSVPQHEDTQLRSARDHQLRKPGLVVWLSLSARCGFLRFRGFVPVVAHIFFHTHVMTFRNHARNFDMPQWGKNPRNPKNPHPGLVCGSKAKTGQLVRFLNTSEYGSWNFISR